MPADAGNVGAQSGFARRNESAVGLEEAEQDLADDAPAHGTELLAAPDQIGFLEDVVPERRAAL